MLQQICFHNWRFISCVLQQPFATSNTREHRRIKCSCSTWYTKH